MQYPQIQFYKGSLVRLASGKLKQVEDLSSDDFLESARLISNNHDSRQHHQPATISMSSPSSSQSPIHIQPHHHHHQGNTNNQATHRLHHHRQVDENNNSVFNSPEPTPSFGSPDAMELEEEEDDDDEELDVVSDGDVQRACDLSGGIGNVKITQQHQLSPTKFNFNLTPATSFGASTASTNRQVTDEEDSLYVDSSVVRDFLEVGPPSSASPTSSGSSTMPCNNRPGSGSQIDLSTGAGSSLSPGIGNCLSPPAANLTVLIKFFLESSRDIVFIEVPIEHPFFVYHRGWSSWNPQRTYDKFGLKCRKLKIGDTCISLIRRKGTRGVSVGNTSASATNKLPHNQQQESDQCNILFSSIKINE